MKFDFLTIYAILIGAMCVFLIYNDLKLIKKAKTVKTSYDLTKFEIIDYSRNYVLMYSALAFLATLMVFLGIQTPIMIVIDVIIVLIAVFEGWVCQFRFKIYYNKKEFIFENELYRYKNISSIKKVSKRGKNWEIKTFNGTVFNLNEKVALKIQELKNAEK